MQFLTENTEFTVVGVIGPTGVGKSTIMNELYGFDATSPGQLSLLTLLVCIFYGIYLPLFLDVLV